MVWGTDGHVRHTDGGLTAVEAAVTDEIAHEAAETGRTVEGQSRIEQARQVHDPIEIE